MRASIVGAGSWSSGASMTMVVVTGEISRSADPLQLPTGTVPACRFQVKGQCRVGQRSGCRRRVRCAEGKDAASPHSSEMGMWRPRTQPSANLAGGTPQRLPDAALGQLGAVMGSCAVSTPMHSVTGPRSPAVDLVRVQRTCWSLPSP